MILRAARVSGRFRSAPVGGGRFRVQGAELANDGFQVGLGWGVELQEKLRVHADYDAILGEDAVAHEFGIAVRLRY